MHFIIKYFVEQRRIWGILFVILQNMVNHYIILKIQFELFDIKIPLKRHLLCSLAISILYILPLYTVDLFFFSPGIYFSVWLYTMLMFINPISGMLLYFVIKKILKLTPTKSSIILRNHLLMHYVVVLMYMLLNNMFYGILPVYEVFINFYFHEIVSIFLIILLLLFVYAFFKIYTKKGKRNISIPVNYNDKNLFFQLLQTFLVLIIFYVGIVFFRIKWLSSNLTTFEPTIVLIYFLVIACIISYLVISISFLRSKFFEWETQAAGTYISSLLHANQEFRNIKHDFYNVLQTYGGYLEIEDYEGLKRYHQALFNQTKTAGDFLSLIEVLKSRIAIYSLFQSKAEMANKAGITYSINMMCDISNIVLNDLDLCRVLSIVIDNAIEAASLSEQKQINISFEKKDKKTIVFVISNTTKDNVHINKIFDYGYTTKQKHSGVGLSQVIHILNSYEHCGYRVNYHDNQFTIFLILFAEEQ